VSTLWQALLFGGLVAGLSFVAALLLSLPSLFSRVTLCRRRRVPPPAPDDLEREQPRFNDPTGWRVILARVIALPFGVLLGVIVFPVIFAMALVGACASYRFYRHLAYRALRRHRRIFAFPLSFSLGLRVFISRTWQHHASPKETVA
jgi:hypothetical protein